MIINLTQHNPTLEQGDVTPPLDAVVALLTFTHKPSRSEIAQRARAIAAAAVAYRDEHYPHANACMIGGAPYLMGPLERALEARKLDWIYSFSERVSREETAPDGTVTKTASFRHVGWV